MSETKRKAIYSAATAILAVLGAYGVIDSSLEGQILSIVQGALTLAAAVVPLLAASKVGIAGVDELPVIESEPPAEAAPAVQADSSDEQGHAVTGS